MLTNIKEGIYVIYRTLDINGQEINRPAVIANPKDGKNDGIVDLFVWVTTKEGYRKDVEDAQYSDIPRLNCWSFN